MKIIQVIIQKITLIVHSSTNTSKVNNRQYVIGTALIIVL